MPMKLFSMPTIHFFFLFLIIINQSLSSRILRYPSPTHHHAHHSLTFYMLDSLTESCPSSSPVTTKVLNGQLPFPKPLGFFPPAGGIPLPDTNPNLSTQMLDLPGIGISFPGKAALEELEFGMVTVIDEALFEGTFGVVQVGKTQGIYVASLDDGSSHMMAMTASFISGEYKDGLRFLGWTGLMFPSLKLQ
ncbi:dirigent protein 16-like [Actinidia eriantha]|uniref:dirigent protein 16-like n=1 Tax=Actinidia eriantha TaxID=165200 RepID=UPI00258F4C61|nr:dirigent protein 16-like [Actinidia eriantha]